MTTTRRYTSELRTSRALRTRHTILRAARRLFERRGFAATTISDIAEEAGVAVPTVYAAFGSKAALVVHLLDQLEADASDAPPSPHPPADAADALRAWLDAHTRIFDRGRTLLRVVLQARGEPGVSELVADGDRHRRDALHEVIVRLADEDHLRAGLDPASALDQAWAISSVAVFVDLTDQCGWTSNQYRDWLGQTFEQLLLDRSLDR